MEASPRQISLPSPTGLLWAFGIGTASGLAAALLRLGFRGLGWLLTGTAQSPAIAAAHLGLTRRFLTPVVGALLALLVLALRRRRAHLLGREPRPFVEYVEAAQQGHGEIPLVPNLWRTLSAAFSVSSGAPVGREGSMIQLAAAIGSAIELRRRHWRLRSSLLPEHVISSAVAAGVTVAYGAPVAGVFFALEIVLKRRRPLDWLPVALASLAGFLVERTLLTSQPLYPVHPVLPTRGWTLPLLPLLALAMGALGPLYQRLVRAQVAGLRHLRQLPGALVFGGAVTGLLSLLDPRVWGNADAGLEASLGIHPSASHALASLLLLRLLATSIATGVGTVGGVFTPTMFTGAALASLLASLLHGLIPSGSSNLWAVVGLSTMLAATTHAPLMAAAITAELTGDWSLFPGLLLLNLLAWALARTLSPSALYAIASPAPAHRDPPQTRTERARPE